MARHKLVVAVDFDDIVGGFNMAFHQWHNRFYGTKFLYNDLITFDMCALYGIDVAELSLRCNRFVHEFHHEILPIAGAVEGLRALHESYDLQLVTSRCESIRTLTINWMEEAGVSDYFSAHHFTCGFNSIYPERKRQKIDVYREIRAVALIEDADHNAHEVAQGGGEVFMLACPWNGNVPHGFISRLDSWDEIVDTIERVF
jgi:uncharacterized HAD superfamily protein